MPSWLIKMIIGQMLKPENRNRLLKLIAGIICVFFLIPAVILLPLSFLTGDELTTDFDITASVAFQEIYPVYQDYITEALAVLNEKAAGVREEHKRWVKEYSLNPETGEREETGGHYEYPDVEVISAEPPLAALLAYLSQKNENILSSKKYSADVEEIKGFYKDISAIEVTGSGMSYTVSYRYLSDAEIGELYFSDSEAQKGLFTQSIALINGFLASAGYGSGGGLNLSPEAMDVLQAIFNTLIENGYSKAAAAGACGNIQQECSFNITLSGAAHGMIQWTGSRFRSLELYAEKNGYSSWKDLDAQIGFMLLELNGSYQSRLNSYAKKYADADTYKEIQDPKLAAFVFCAVYEGCEYNPDKGWGVAQGSSFGPDGKRWQQLDYRQKYAEAIFNAFSGGGSSSMGQIANGSSSQKLAALFPSGLPTTQSTADRYMEKIPVSVWDGSKKVTKYVTLHKALKADIQAIFEDIADAKIRLKSVSGYSWRGMNNGGSGSRSHHSYGVALDIDPDYNPSGKYSGNPVGVRPDLSCYYFTYPWKPGTEPLSIEPTGIVVRAFESRGWVWGAKWGTVSNPIRTPYASGYHDFMHFSFTGN